MTSNTALGTEGNSKLIKTLLNDMSRGADLIVAAFNNNLTAVRPEDEANFEKLKAQNILMSTIDGYRLNPHVNRLIRHVLKIDSRSYIDVGLKTRLRNIQILAESYIDHKRLHQDELAHDSLLALEQLVFEIHFDAHLAVNSLSQRLLTQFGFVKNLHDKIIENEAAITLASDLVDNLTAYTFSNMMEYVNNAGNDSDLYRILISELLSELAACQSELNGIMGQLRKMLSTFREQVRKTNLLKSFSEHWIKNSGYNPKDYTDDLVPNELFTRAEPLTFTSHADFDNPLLEDELISIIHSLKENKLANNLDNQDVTPTGFTEPPQTFEEQYEYEGLEDDLIEYFRYVAQQKDGVSAVNYFHENKDKFECSCTNWLFSIYAFYENMELSNKQHYIIKPNDEFQHIMNKEASDPSRGFGDMIILDLETSFKV